MATPDDSLALAKLDMLTTLFLTPSKEEAKAKALVLTFWK
jgi:hypothetical protein